LLLSSPRIPQPGAHYRLAFPYPNAVHIFASSQSCSRPHRHKQRIAIARAAAAPSRSCSTPSRACPTPPRRALLLLSGKRASSFPAGGRSSAPALLPLAASASCFIPARAPPQILPHGWLQLLPYCPSSSESARYSSLARAPYPFLRRAGYAPPTARARRCSRRAQPGARRRLELIVEVARRLLISLE
jgi:hypothetical protein